MLSCVFRLCETLEQTKVGGGRKPRCLVNIVVGMYELLGRSWQKEQWRSTQCFWRAWRFHRERQPEEDVVVTYLP